MNKISEKKYKSAVASNASFPNSPPRIPWFRRLSVAQKIGFGYAIAISVSVLGTMIGTLVGDYYQEQAVEKERHADEEVELLNELQSGILKARTHQQQFIALVDKPEDLQEEYSNFLKHAENAKETWSEMQSFLKEMNIKDQEDEDIKYDIAISKFMKTYEGVPKVYFEQVDKLIKQIDAPNLKSPAQIQAAQKLLLDFTNSSVALKFDDISDNLRELVESAEEGDEESDEALVEAIYTRRIIILITDFISITLAFLLAYYTSRAIARPIKNLTAFAEETTLTSNFELQAPITTNDEVGVLANSLNQLIIRVQQLLIEQLEVREKLQSYNQNLEIKVKKRTQELENILQELQNTQTQLIQREKMSSLGQLVAGVAHEINNPVNFIHGNLEYTKDYIQDLLKLVTIYQSEYPHPTEIIEQEIERVDFNFLKEDLPDILSSMETGSERIREIVKSLRTFSRLDEADCKEVDIHESIDSTLMILQGRLNGKPQYTSIEVIKNYGQLPLIECYSGQLNQVFLNLIVNAIDVLEEELYMAKDNPFLTPQIIISTKLLNSDWIAIHIADNGLGMTEEVRAQIFNPFFTTKPVGKGTGLGLAISYQIVVDRHHGELHCSSIPGKGTEFRIEIPVKQRESEEMTVDNN